MSSRSRFRSHTTWTMMLLKQSRDYWKKDLRKYGTTWMTGKLKTTKEGTYCSIKGRTTFPKMTSYEERFCDDTMITTQQDILENSKHSMQYGNITGGQECEPLSRNMSKGVELVNNIKSTETHQNQHSDQWRQPNLHDLFLIVPWT